MSLSQSIVVVNEFSVKGADGRGSRGSTPGLYVERYVVDDDKNESLWPLTCDDIESASMRYERLFDDVMGSKSFGEASRIAGRARDGVAFSADAISLSFSETKSIAKRIQEAFDEGKTVFKTVITFDDDYLASKRIIEGGLDYSRMGAHRGHVDQLRLRSAIQDGMSRLSEGFDDLLWVASAHLDRTHVHFHVASVDLGKGRIRHDGQQKGTFSRRDIGRIRLGIDDSLSHSMTLRPLFRQPTVERTRVANTLRSYVHVGVERVGLSQMLLATLPDDKSLWHYGTNLDIMARPDELVRACVEDVISRPSITVTSTMNALSSHVESVCDREGIFGDARAARLLRARDTLISSCCEAVYDDVRMLSRNFSTETIRAMASTNVPAFVDDGLERLCARARVYSARLAGHVSERRKFRSEEMRYISASDKSEQSSVAFDFYSFERMYNEQLMAKYQWLMSFYHPSRDWRDRVREVVTARVAAVSMRNMISDVRMAALSFDDAETRGKIRWGIDGAGVLSGNPHALDKAVRLLDTRFEDVEAKLAFDAAEDGLKLAWQESPRRIALSLEHEPLYEFDDVKALDLHHMRNDFDGGLSASANSIFEFVDCAAKRKERLDEALDYFRDTGQSEIIKALPVADVEAMWAFAQSLMDNGDVSGTTGTGVGDIERHMTVELSESLGERVRGVVESAMTRAAADGFSRTL